jgi:adenosylhomocysteine nucleosidase
MPSIPRRYEVVTIAALRREVAGLIRHLKPVEHEYEGRKFNFFEQGSRVIVCGGIGIEAARRAAEAAIRLYNPGVLESVGFAGALQRSLRVGDIVAPSTVIDSRDGSRVEIPQGNGLLLTAASVAGSKQKRRLAEAYGAHVIDMEAAGVAAAAKAHALGFRAIKVISDELNFEMPDMARFIDAQGEFCTFAFAACVALRPWLWARTVALARNSGTAARSLAEYMNDPQRSRSNAVAARTV